MTEKCAVMKDFEICVKKANDYSNNLELTVSELDTFNGRRLIENEFENENEYEMSDFAIFGDMFGYTFWRAEMMDIGTVSVQRVTVNSVWTNERKPLRVRK